MNSLATKTITEKNKITEDLYVQFIEFIDAKPRTIETYTRALRRFFEYLYLNDIQQPTRSDILVFRDKLKKTLKPTTVQNYITTVRLFFQWTEQEGLYKNIASHIKGATLDREHKKDYLTSDQVKTILKNIDRSTIKGLRDYAILVLMTTGGLRTIEVTRATLEDLRTLGNTTALYIQGKGKDEKTEYVKIQVPVEEAIRSYLKERGSVKMTDPLFASLSNNNRGCKLTTRSISEIVKTRMKDAGYDNERLTAHSLRHTAVTLSLLGGNTLQEVQQFARHANITTTQIYAHNLDRAKNKCESTITEAIF